MSTDLFSFCSFPLLAARDLREHHGAVVDPGEQHGGQRADQVEGHFALRARQGLPEQGGARGARRDPPHGHAQVSFVCVCFLLFVLIRKDCFWSAERTNFSLLHLVVCIFFSFFVALFFSLPNHINFFPSPFLSTLDD